MTTVIVWIAFAILAYAMAEKRGRNPKLAIVGGLLFGVFAAIYYLIVGDSKEMRKQKLVAEIEANHEPRSTL